MSAPGTYSPEHAVNARVAHHPMYPVPVSAAKAIAETYGYDQVVIIARRVGEDPAPYGEHVTTYGRGEEHRTVAARIGAFLQARVMDWLQGGESDLLVAVLAEHALLIETATRVIEAEAAFRAQMPSSWNPDPLSDAVAAMVARVPVQTAKGGAA